MNMTLYSDKPKHGEGDLVLVTVVVPGKRFATVQEGIIEEHLGLRNRKHYYRVLLNDSTVEAYEFRISSLSREC